jgi:ketosteroid isomerase-like protein
MSGTDRAATKVLFATLRSALPGLRMQIENLVAEGDAVVARFTMETTNAENKTLARGLTYYRLANGKIVEDEPITTPDLRQLLGVQLPAPAGS